MKTPFLYMLGISMLVLGIYRIIKVGYKSKKVKTVHLFLGCLAVSFLIEAIDFLTVNWLYNLLGKIIYYRSIGVVLDILILGAYFGCDDINPISEKEKALNNIRIAISVVGFSWYFMYYLCQ